MLHNLENKCIRNNLWIFHTQKVTIVRKCFWQNDSNSLSKQTKLNKRRVAGITALILYYTISACWLDHRYSLHACVYLTPSYCESTYLKVCYTWHGYRPDPTLLGMTAIYISAFFFCLIILSPAPMTPSLLPQADPVSILDSHTMFQRKRDKRN